MRPSLSIKIEINKQTITMYLLYLVIVLRLLLPSYIVELIPTFFLLILRYVSMLLMLLYAVLYGFRPNKPFCLITIISFCGIVSTISNQGSIVTALVEYTYIIIECAFVLSVIESDEYAYVFMTVIRNITLIFAFSNLLVGIVMPEGIPSYTVFRNNPYFLYGNLNSIMRGIMPGICCSMIIDKKKEKTISISTMLLFASVLYFCFRIYFMATSFLGIALLITWIFLKTPIKNNYIKVYLGIVIVVLLVEVFVVLLGSSSYASLISGLFSMKTGFTGRERLWSNVIFRIQERKLLGYGITDQDQTLQLIGNAYGCHNYYLDIIFRRGIVGLIPMLLLFLQPLIDKRENISDECYILLGCCCAYFVMFLMEPFIGTEYLHLPIFCVAMSLLLKEQKWRARIRISS